MPFTAPPDAPTRADGSSRATFVAKCNAFIAWFSTFYTELVAFGAALNNLSTSDTSTTSNTISIAAGKTFTVTAGKSWQVGMQLLIANTASPTNWMFGDVTSYSGTTLVVNATAIQGSGAGVTTWTISLSGPNGSAGSAALTTAANTWTKAQRGTPVALSDASTIAIDASLSNNFYVTLAGANRTLGTPTNLVAGQSGYIDIHQDATGSRDISTYDWVWQFAGGTEPTLTTAARAKDKLCYSVDWYQSAAVTMTIAAPCVITLASGIPNGTPCRFTTTGALPTGLVAGTTYYLIPSGASAYNVSATQNGSAITTTGSQSGTHTIIVCSITASLLTAIKPT